MVEVRSVGLPMKLKKSCFLSQVIIVKCVDELHRTNKERDNDEEREAAKDIVEKLVSKQQIEHILI